jgi:hypothetical protein
MNHLIYLPIIFNYSFILIIFSDSIMGARLSRSDFQWVYTDEPHTTRRREMLRMLRNYSK